MTKEISRIELFCDDSQVGRIQRLLNGIKGIHEVKTMPVVNAEVKPNGKLHAVTDGNLVQQFMDHATGRNEITIDETRDWLESVGRSRLSYGYVIKGAVKAHFLKKTTRRGVYTVRTP